MFRRVAILAVLCACLIALFPDSVSAHGPLPRGIVLNRPATLRGVTGNCACLQQWYTMGLKRGAVSVSAHITGCTVQANYACGAQVELLRAANRTLVKLVQVTCTGGRTCPATARLSARLAKSGVYYILVHGQGSLSIHYALKIHGRIYALRCRKYC
jgi:hypothetical protein